MVWSIVCFVDVVSTRTDAPDYGVGVSVSNEDIGEHSIFWYCCSRKMKKIREFLLLSRGLLRYPILDETRKLHGAYQKLTHMRRDVKPNRNANETSE